MSTRIVASALFFLLFPISHVSGSAPDHQACGRGWCLVFPVGEVKATPPFGSSAWNKLVYVPDDGRFFIYTSDGIYTFSNSWWSYGVLRRRAIVNPWIEESTSGTIQATVTDNSKGFLKSAITPADRLISLRAGDGHSFHPDAAHGGVLVIDDEEIAYDKTNLSGDTFSNVIRGVRGTTPAKHTAGAIVTAGAPFPQSRRDGALVATTDHIPDRHPFLSAAYDSRRHRIFQAGGIIENTKQTDTWYFCLVENDFCPTSDMRVWKRLCTRTPAPARADSAMTYDADDDVMILYGGQNVGNPTAETWVLCFRGDPQSSGNNVGCPADNKYPDWVRISSTTGSPGPRFAHSLVYDIGHHVAVLFGGVNVSSSDPSDTWIYFPQDRTWKSVLTDGAHPGSFRRPAMAYDSTRGRVVLYEGPSETTGGDSAGGTFFYDAGANRWQQIQLSGGPVPSSPDNSVAHGRLSLDYDSKNDVFVATELGPGYSLQVWELQGSIFDDNKPRYSVP